MTDVTNQPTQQQFTPQELRRALGQFASGVTVVTTADVPGDVDTVHGMTANAFTSVSMDPPLVLISVAKRAHMDSRIHRCGRYGISVMSHEQHPLSLHFAGATNYPGEVDFVWRDGIALVDGALLHLTCTVADSHSAGDHTLHVGRVTSLWHQPAEPLIFFTGAFHTLGSPLC